MKLYTENNELHIRYRENKPIFILYERRINNKCYCRYDKLDFAIPEYAPWYNQDKSDNWIYIERTSLGELFKIKNEFSEIFSNYNYSL